jgi:hypothetical protein
MAAFCACCGAAITLKAEACPVCGTPQHGMSLPDLQPPLNAGTGAFNKVAESGENGIGPGPENGAKLTGKPV